jgi:hypothetical protein
MVSTDGYIYEHEVGFAYDSASFMLKVDQCNWAMATTSCRVRQVVPDEQTLGEAVVSFKTRITQLAHNPHLDHIRQPTRLLSGFLAVRSM